MFYLLKIVIALIVIIGATELSKKNTTLAAILLAMPIIFFVSFTLIWEESKDRSLISGLIQETTMYILPVIPFLFLFSFLVKSGFNYYLALFIAIVGITVGTLANEEVLLKKGPIKSLFIILK
jgi:uncharacterized membrane protein YoaK (UPF0700 family)